MSFVSSVFSSLKVSVGNSLATAGVNAALNALNYTKRDGQLKFISHRGYDNVYAYAAKRTMMQMTFATINDLYPKYVRQLEQKQAKTAYNANQGSEMTKIIENGRKTDEDSFNDQQVNIRYKGKPANEALLLWVKNQDNTAKSFTMQTYWDKVKGLSNDAASKSYTTEDTKIEAPYQTTGANTGMIFVDFGPIVQVQSANNVVMTKVTGRDYSRKELVSGGDVNFTVTGKITSNYPDVYPYDAVSRFITLMQHKGVLQVYNILFKQFNVTQILIKDFQLGQNEGYKNTQPYSFTCVAVEPDTEVKVVEDTINATNLKIKSSVAKSWSKNLLEKVKASAASQAAQMLESLTASVI